jgi:hypothetical protein
MSTETTNVVGYFNPNNYPMQIVVAEHNVTLHLKSKEWVFDRDHRRVNDPILDKYVGKGRLSRASDQAQKVPVVRLKAVNRPQTVPNEAPANYQHPVFAATGFVRDANGQTAAVRPAPTAPLPTVPPPVSYNPVQAMSVEQARKLRLIKPTRQVSEDYGVPDNAGIPVSGDKIPAIKYAHDTTREVQAPTVVAQPMTAEQAALVHTMQEAQALDPESSNFADAAAAAAVRAAAVQPTSAVIPPPPPPPSNELLKSLTKPAPVLPPPLPAFPEPTMMTPTELPEPDLTSETPAPVPVPAPSSLVVEEEIGQSATPVGVVAPAEGAVKLPTVCPLCAGKEPFSTPGYLVRHINNKHADRAPVLLKQLGLV